MILIKSLIDSSSAYPVCCAAFREMLNSLDQYLQNTQIYVAHLRKSAHDCHPVAS